LFLVPIFGGQVMLTARSFKKPTIKAYRQHGRAPSIMDRTTIFSLTGPFYYTNICSICDSSRRQTFFKNDIRYLIIWEEDPQGYTCICLCVATHPQTDPDFKSAAGLLGISLVTQASQLPIARCWQEIKASDPMAHRQLLKVSARTGRYAALTV